MEKPNVLLTACDQLRAHEVACYGHPTVRTPNIDALAAKGVLFEQAFTVNPVCTPARSALLAGQYSRSCTGMLGNVHANPPNPNRVRLMDTTLPEAFRAAGYATALIGKWHIDPQPQLVGFDTALYPKVSHKYYGQTYYTETGDSFVVDEWGPDWELSRLDAFLSDHRQEPFFVFYNISLPHQPIGPDHLAPRYRNLYSRRDVRLRENVGLEGDRDHRENWYKIYRSDDFFWLQRAGLPERPEDALPEGFDIIDLTTLYYGAVTATDDLLGKALHLLERYGLADNTIVVFISDHGDNLGSHDMFNKNSLIEEAIRIPLVIKGPTIPKGKRVTQHLASTIDVAPTIIEATELPSVPTMQGKSLRSIYQSASLPESNCQDRVFIETGKMLGVRTKTHLYGIGFDEKDRRIDESVTPRFYDLRADPYELDNLARSGTQVETEKRMDAVLTEWNRKVPWLDAPPHVKTL